MAVMIQRPTDRILTIGDMGAVEIVQRAPLGVANGLLNNLIAYWPGNEAGGNLIDAHTNVLHLTDYNTVTSNPGLVYPLARQYTAVNAEFHARASEPLLEFGDVDFTIFLWIYLDSKATARTLLGKYQLGTEMLLNYSAGADVFRASVWTGGGQQIVNANTYGSPLITTWLSIAVQHSAILDTLSIQVDNGAIDSIPTGGPLVAPGPDPFQIGTYDGLLAPAFPMQGRIGPTAFWKSVPGGGAVLSAEQRTALYNGGAGLPYASFTT